MATASELKVEQLEQQVLAGGKGLSSLTELARRSACEWPSEPERTAARHSIRRSFTHLVDNGFLSKKASSSEAEAQLGEWLRGEYNAYVDFLNECVWSDESTVQESLVAMRTLFWFCGKESHYASGQNGGLRSAAVRDFLASALQQKQGINSLLLTALKDEYLVKFSDFHRTFLREFAKLCTPPAPASKKARTSTAAAAAAVEGAFWKPAFQLLSLVPAKPGQDVLAAGTAPEKHMKKPFQSAWLAFLGLPPNSSKERRQALALLPGLIPHFPQPQLLCDFLTSCFSTTAEDEMEIPFIAFSSLFVLVRDYQLDYPDLYLRLYKLLDAFRVESQPEFGLLVDACFKSSHLPLQLVASFAKKLGRIALLTTSPATSIFALALVYNLLRRNPSLLFLIHSAQTAHDKQAEMKSNARRIALGLGALQPGSGNGGAELDDTFAAGELDYDKSGAMGSSLWEVESLKHHHCPSVSSFARSVFAHDLAKDRLTKPELPLQDFATTWQELFAQESRVKQSAGEQKQRLKADAPLNVHRPTEDAFCGFVLFQ